MDLASPLRNKPSVLLIGSMLASTFAIATPQVNTEVPQSKRAPPPREAFHIVDVDGERVLQGGFLPTHIADSDQDGVHDNTDQCPATLKNATANNQGCSTAQLAALSTPELIAPVAAKAPTSLDLDNCALDNDQDGVNNCQDTCNNTLPNLGVTSEGCLDKTQLPRTSTLAFKFDINDWALKPEFQTTITQLSAFLQQHPDLQVTLYGHAEWLTDKEPEPSFSYWLTYWRTNNIINQLNNNDVIERGQLNAAEYNDLIPTEISTLIYGALQNQQIHVYIQPRTQD